MQTWSVGILCYNEAGTLEKVTTDLIDVLKQLTNTYEVLIVDDRSTDGSRVVANDLAQKHPEIRVITHEVNKGIGGAIRTIYDQARYENVGFIPGDGQFDIKEYLPFKEVPENHFVCFYRKENTSYSLFRNILSLVNKKLNSIFLGITVKDVNWTKIYKRKDIKALHLELTSSLIESEVCAKLLYQKKRVIEAESKYLPRTYGESKGSSARIIKKALKDTLVLIRIMRKFRAQQKKA
ncbi:MAG: glycosyltransferase family 2 protein [Flavipsychrobacter sp.]|nr:glycosyltransferase family 2 protein [Flavipsychrobacter sp.]